MTRNEEGRAAKIETQRNGCPEKRTNLVLPTDGAHEKQIWKMIAYHKYAKKA